MAKGMKKSANEKLRDKYGLTNVKSEPVTKKQKEVAVTQSATGGRKSSLQGAAIGTSKPTTPKKPAQIKAQDSPLLSAAKRFVSNPVGTVSDAVMKPIDDITERITSPSKKLKQEQNRLTQNQKQANSKQTDVGRLLGGMAVKAADDVVSGVAGLGDMTLGTAARAFGWENNPFSQWNKLAQTTQQANREYYSKNTANAGKVVQTVDELGTALVEALPQLAIAYMTAGGSLATEGAGAIAQATGRLAGTEAAQAASKLPGAIKTARAVANNLKTDPQFWTSFADMSGRYYNDAKQDGADDWTATMYALATGIMNAGIEIGGGIQKLPGEMKKTERSLLSLIKSAHEEGTEEPIQGIIERASQNLILGKENPLFSLTDENAVFNPKTAAKEYGTGAAVGFGLGAVPAIRRGIQNSTNQPTPDMIAEVVKATPDPARAVQNIQAMQTRQAEQNAVQATPEPQTAQSTAAVQTRNQTMVDEQINEIAQRMGTKRNRQKVNGYSTFVSRDTTREGATITVKRPDGTNIKERIDGGRYWTNDQLNYRAASMIYDDMQASGNVPTGSAPVQQMPEQMTAIPQAEQNAAQATPEPQTAQQSAAAQEPEAGTPEKADTDILWTAPKDNSGWKTKYNGYSPVNDALSATDGKLYAAFGDEVDRSEKTGDTHTPITNAVIAAGEDVRQGTVSPMAAARLLSDMYNDGGTDTLERIVNPRTGNLYRAALEYAKNIDEQRRNAERRGETARNATETPVTDTEAPQATPVASSGIQELETVKQAIGRNPTFDDLVNYYSQQGETGFQSYQRIADAFERGELVDGGNSGIYTRAEIEQRQTSMPEADHIDNRTPEYNSKVSTKPFQLTHPELHPYFSEAAKALQQEAINSFSSDVPNMRKGGKIYYISSGLRKVMEMTGLSRQQISKCCQDIIDNHGAEDYASAKHVEAALDYLMTNGAQFQNEAFPSNQAYLEAKGKITGGTDPNTFDYALEHEYGDLIATEEMTVDEARADWEKNHPQQTPANQANAAFAEQTPANQANAEPAVTPESSVPQRNGLPEGQGAMSAQFPYREAQSQTNSTNPIYTDRERTGVDGLRPEDRTHQVRTNADVDAHADERIEFDYDGEKADLFRDDKEWDVVDLAVAQRILDTEARNARESGNWDELRQLQKVYDEKASNWGQVGHEMGRHAHSPANLVNQADEIMGDGVDEQERGRILNRVYDAAEELNNMREGGEGDILALIRRLNAQRRTGGFFTPARTGNTLNRALEAVAERGEYDFLYDVAESQILGMASDVAPLSPIEAVKSVRYQAMLSKLTTVFRNLVGNNAFDPTESMSNNIGVIADLFMSLRTGRRSTALDASWLSGAKRRGSIEAMQRAYIETALDADVSGIENRYENTPGRTFKMASRNPLARFLSTVEKWQGYALNVTDEFQKGGIEAETQRGIDSLERRGLLEPGALDGWAEETARERTFQNNGRMANSLVGFRNAANNLYSINDRRGGSFGLGDAILPFARVPANVVGQFLNYSPAGLVRGTRQMLDVMIRGQNATAQEQATAARAFGRGINGTMILTLFAWAAANGVLNVADGGDDDDEKDLARLRQTEGVTGTQFNLSAALRGMNGESTEWRNDDDLMNIGFLEPINGLMALGSLIWDSAQDEEGITAGDIGSATAEAALQAISDLPAVSSLTNIFNNYKYSTAEDTGGKVAETAVKFLGDTATSIIPNALSGIAQGMDEGTVRDTYSSEKSGIPGVLENTLNAAKAKIPGEKGRESLPTSLDNFGQERKTTASPFMNWLNSNILPGSITKYQTNAVKQELERLMESGADVSVPNRAAEKKVDTENGEKKLTYDEKRNYQKTYGGETFKGLNELFQSSAYKSLTNDEKAEAEKNVVSFATAKAKQKVGGKAEDPSWATKSDGTMAQNAVYNAQYKTARNTAKQATGKDSPSDGDVLISLSNRGLDYDTTVKIMAQFMEPNTIKKYETAYADGYDFGLSAAFSGAYYEKSYDFGTTDSGNPKQRGKDNTIQWAQENLGLTRSQAIMLYNYLIKR